jgi:hypothetical protein
MGTEPQSIPYLEKVESLDALTNYCTKYIGRRNSFYDLLYKGIPKPILNKHW